MFSRPQAARFDSTSMWLGFFVSAILPLAQALGQEPIIAFGDEDLAGDGFQLTGEGVAAGQILVSDNDYWGVIRAAGDLAIDFGRVTGTNLTLSNGELDAEPPKFSFAPVDVSNNTVVSNPVDEIMVHRSSANMNTLVQHEWHSRTDWATVF